MGRTRIGLTFLMTLVACGGEVLEGRGADDAGAGDGDTGVESPRDSGMPDGAVMDAGSDGAVPAADPYGVCSPDGWCLERPSPTGQDLLTAQVLGDSLWLLGTGGALIHFDGSGFRSADSGATLALRGSFAFGADELWAVGEENAVLRLREGASTSLLEAPGPDAGQSVPDDFNAVWGATPDDVWIVGDHGALWHFDGERLEKQTAPSGEHLRAIWGTAADDVWVLGHNGSLLRYDGMAWSHSNIPGGAGLQALAGTSETDVWAVGNEGRVLHFDGTLWQPLELTLPIADFFDVEVLGEGEILVVGSHGATYEFDGSWHAWTSGTEETLRAIARTQAGLIYTLGDHGTVVSWQGDTRRVLSQSSRTNHLAIFAGRDGSTWIAGDAAYRLDAAGLVSVDTGTPRALYDGFAASPSSGWAVGTAGTILKISEGQFSPMESRTDRPLRAVWAANENSAWVVGDHGLVLGLLNGSSWQTVAANVQVDLHAVWGLTQSDAWLVGDTGTTAHWDGERWTKVPTTTTAGLRALWGSAPEDVWAAGTLGTLLHWNGKAWSIAAEGEGYTLHGLWGKDAREVYAVGSGGTVLRYDGESWQLESTPTDAALFGILGSEDGILRAVGENGVILYKR